MFFDKSFFDEENRDGFVVPEMMKRAWAAEMEVLAVIDDVCKKHDIHYYAAFGTLLGAVRHKGFIPWDDDIDLCMLRDDYDRFIQVAPDSLEEGFVLSGAYGSCERLWAANTESQLRVIADETILLLPKYMNRFHGFPYPRVGVDIFPMDNLPEDKDAQLDMVREIVDLQYTVKNWRSFQKERKLLERLKKHAARWGTKYDMNDEDGTKRNLILKIDEISASYRNEDTDKVANILYLNVPKDPENFKGYLGLRKEWYGEGTLLPYEQTNIRVPTDYQSVLRYTYGKNYMTPKPFTGLHDYPFYKTQEKAFDQLLEESGIDTPVNEFCRNWHEMTGGN